MNIERPPSFQKDSPFGSLVLPRVTSALTIPLEIEVRFFIPKEIATRLIRGRTASVIEQHYFPTRRIARVLASCRNIPTFTSNELGTEESPFSQARLRRTSGKTTTYELEFKGAKFKHADSTLARHELSIPISRERFKKLLPLASSGSIRKERYLVRGYIFNEGTHTPIYAQIYNFTSAGCPPKSLPRKLFTVDIELPHSRLYPFFKRGNHSLKFLNSCIELRPNENKRHKPFANKRLAKTGFEHRLPRLSMSSKSFHADKD